MTYRIARGAQTFGPYTAAEVERYLASGNIIADDLAQAEDDGQWTPVRQLFPAAVAVTPVAISGQFPDPPDLPWWLALILGVLTGGIFFVVWDVIQALWLRRVERNSIAFALYLGSAVVYVLKLPHIWHTIDYNMLGGPLVESRIPGVGLAGIVLAVAARFVFRGELMRHFNQSEPIGLRLNWLWTLLLGGLYFQFEFNRINDIKRALRAAVV